MPIALFAIIGMEIGAGKLYWVMLALTAVMKLLDSFFGF